MTHTGPRRILIVDDDPLNLDLLEQELTDQGYAVDRASDGEEAVQKVPAFDPDVVLLDYMMPKMDGLQVIKHLKKDERYRSLPIVLLTGKGSADDKVKGLDAGADDYIVKPFETFELLARIRTVLRIKEMHETLEDWNRTLEDRVKQQVDEINKIGQLSRYVSPQIANMIREGDQSIFASHRREITVTFLDLRGFTTFSDSAEPEEVMAVLGQYHGEMGRLIFKYEGTLERFAGDGIMVFFNDPVPTPDHTERAVRMGIEMRERVRELRRDWVKRGYDLDLGVGIAAGFATLGNIGFEARIDYGAVGRVTNLAQRLSDAAKGGQILVDQKTLAKIETVAEYEPIEEMQFKGFARPVPVFNVVGLKKR